MMDHPHEDYGDLRPQRTETEDTAVVIAAFLLVAIAVGGLIYAYSGPHGPMVTASNMPPPVASDRVQ
jgi:hypothetical protein